MEGSITVNPEEIADTRKRLIALEEIVKSHDERLKSLEAQPKIILEPEKK